jgi:hypothetical protein
MSWRESGEGMGVSCFRRNLNQMQAVLGPRDGQEPFLVDSGLRKMGVHGRAYRCLKVVT